jgi:hypothetical protein
MDNSEKIERTLNSIQNIGRAKANPYMFEKIKQKMNEPGGTKNSSVKFILASSFAVITIAVINVSIWLNYSSAYSDYNKTTVSSKQDISTFAKEYFNQSSESNY